MYHVKRLLDNNFSFQLFTIQYILLLIANLIPLNISFIAFVFEITFPIYIGYFKAILEFSFIPFAVFLQIESIWIKYWFEFKWKCVKPIDDQFVVTSLVYINLLLALSLSSAGVIISGGTLPLTLGIVSPYDRTMNMNENERFIPRYLSTKRY